MQMGIHEVLFDETEFVICPCPPISTEECQIEHGGVQDVVQNCDLLLYEIWRISISLEGLLEEEEVLWQLTHRFGRMVELVFKIQIYK